MLEGLDSVPWSKLTHAYGEAEDVPAQLRALASEDQEARDKALHKSYGNIFHQGTRYQVTPYVVPFLLELASNPAVADRSNLVYLLIHLALGYPEQFYRPASMSSSFAARAWTRLPA